MIKIENTEVIGWEAAIRGMRNPLESWAKSDSGLGCDEYPQYTCAHCGAYDDTYAVCPGTQRYKIGPNDFDLMKRLRNAGTDHRKFMRMIVVYANVTAPLYWLKEFDTYKISTVANSCSTMHTIHKKKFTLDDFSCEHLTDAFALDNATSPLNVMEHMIFCLNFYRDFYLKTKDKRYWQQMIQLLPSSYNQKRTVMLNYEVLANMYHSRKNHKLDEWRDFCKWIESLPYSEIITGEDVKIFEEK